MRWFAELREDIKAILIGVKALQQPKHLDPKEMSVSLMRRLLGSIDPENLPEVPKVNHEAFVNRVGPAADELIALCHRLIREQERFTTVLATDWIQAIFGRGTLNGIALLEEEFKRAKAQLADKNRPVESFDPHSTIPE